MYRQQADINPEEFNFWRTLIPSLLQKDLLNLFHSFMWLFKLHQQDEQQLVDRAIKLQANVRKNTV